MSAALTVVISGCGPEASTASPVASDDPFERAELAARALYDRTPVDVTGCLLDRDGAPLGGAVVELAGQTSTSDESGGFGFTGIPRRNAMLVAHEPGFRTEQVPLKLAAPLDQATVEVPQLWLFPAGFARLTFGGDVQLGRRYLDPSGETPPDQIPPGHPHALIQASSSSVTWRKRSSARRSSKRRSGRRRGSIVPARATSAAIRPAVAPPRSARSVTFRAPTSPRSR